MPVWWLNIWNSSSIFMIMKKGKLRVLVLGAGFGGLEISSILSRRMGDHLDLTLIDKSGFFYFGYSKFDVMFGLKPAYSVKHSYKKIKNPGVTFRQESITAIDPVGRRVTTERASYHADVLVIALGADYDIPATPGLSEAGNEFYSFKGAERIRKILPAFKKGNVIVGVTGFPFKCPPAPSEAAILLDEYLTRQGVRKDCNISLILPFELPVPPSYGTSKALLKTFKERNIRYIPEMMVASLDPLRKVAILDDGTEEPFDLFLGIPEHRVPKVVEESGLLFDEWVPVDESNLKTSYPNVYAIGDVASAGTPKAGLFAESAAQTAAENIIAEYNYSKYPGSYKGAGSCYVEFGVGKVSRVDVDFLSKSSPSGIHFEASTALSDEKTSVDQRRLARWFDVSS
jgi:sulfide:quinone oxidoreductase